MATPFERFASRMQDASDEDGKRNLLAELGMWRAQRLTDIPAMREASYAMACLYQTLGEGDSAVREARQLLSLCQTSPEATADEMKAATAFLQSLGIRMSVPVRSSDRARSARKPKQKPAPRPEKPGPMERVAQAALSGDWPGMLRSLRGRKGPRAELVRQYAMLASALGLPEEAREKALQTLLSRMRHRLDLPEVDPNAEVQTSPAREKSTPPVSPTTGAELALTELLGAPLPSGREPLLRMLEAFAAENPDKIDALASASLAHHVARRGVKVPAPWLVGFVARARATGPAPMTTRTLADLRRRKAYAVTAYEEWPFKRALEVLAMALRDGWDFIGFRRGLLARGEPGSRKIWTLRLSHAFMEHLLVVAPNVAEPYRGDLVSRLVSRMKELGNRIVLLAPGEGNEALRNAAAESGIPAIEDDADAVVLAALQSAPLLEDVGAPERSEKGEAGSSENEKPLVRVERILLGEAAPKEEELTDAIRGLRRTFRAFRFAPAVAGQPDRLAILLKAAHEAEEPGRRLNEGTTWTLRALASQPEGPVARLMEDPAIAARYGGSGFDTVVEVARGLMAWGIEIDRVLRGPTRRNLKDQPALEAFSAPLRPLWRLGFPRGATRAEVWVCDGLETEGMAGLPLLLVERTPVAVVTSNEQAAGFKAAGAPNVVPWEEGAIAALTALLP